MGLRTSDLQQQNCQIVMGISEPEQQNYLTEWYWSGPWDPNMKYFIGWGCRQIDLQKDFIAGGGIVMSQPTKVVY